MTKVNGMIRGHDIKHSPPPGISNQHNLLHYLEARVLCDRQALPNGY